MIPWELLDEAEVPGGGRLTLHRRGHEHVIRIDGQDLMSNRMFNSERELALMTCRKLRSAEPRILIGGLGLGFTLAAALEVLPEGAEVIVSELVPAVLDWNQRLLGELAGHPLDDARVDVQLGDVCDAIRNPDAPYDAILLDVDNGPDGMTAGSNDWLYGKGGLGAARRALNPGGVLGVWAAFEDPEFTRRARSAGFDVEVLRVRGHGKKGVRHTIWLARN